MDNLTENLFDAIQTIVDKTIENQSYNKTIQATIIDNSASSEGKYTLTDGSVTFTAYSSTEDYNVEDSVYVLLLNGDFTGQKIIIGKQIVTKQDTFVSLDSFKSLIDISNNLIESNVPITSALVANSAELNKQEILLWEKEFKTPIVGFSKLGVAAEFMSWLSSFKTVSGTYGLCIQIYVKGQKYPYLLYFTNKDMFGDTFNFSAYYKQNKVFDISEINNITNISIYFFQETNSFINQDNNLIMPVDGLGNVVADNLFVRNPYICFGYDKSEFNSDIVRLYTSDDLTYSSTYPYGKKITLKWFHYEGEEVTEITQDSAYNFEIRWYQYQLGSNSDSTALNFDPYVSANWEYITSNNFILDFIPDLIMSSGQVKAVVIDKDNNMNYETNIITFENTELAIAPNNNNSGLFFTFTDESNGNYHLYGPGNTILNNLLAEEERGITAHLANTTVDGTPAHDFLNDDVDFTIEWEYPTANTMLIIDESTKNDITLRYKINEYYGSNLVNNKIICNIYRKDIKYSNDFTFSFGSAGTSGTDVTLLINFKDNAKALIANTQTEIVDEVVAITLDTKEQLSDGTYEITPGETRTETKIVSFENCPGLELHLYDSTNKEIDITNYDVKWGIVENSINNSELWFYNRGGYKVANTNNETVFSKNFNEVYLRGEYPIKSDDLIIVYATLSGYGTYDLTTYFALPIAASSSYTHLAGLTTVIYSTLGAPASNNIPYELYSGDLKIECDWKIYAKELFENVPAIAIELNDVSSNFVIKDENENLFREVSSFPKTNDTVTDEEFYMSLCEEALANSLLYRKIKSPSNGYVGELYKNENGEYLLKPLSMYVQNAPLYGVQAYNDYGIMWSQPILTLQNSYPSKTINKWDGTSVETNEGSVIAPMIAAGRKEEDNTFTGIMMGDLLVDSSGEISQVGLYGFHRGAANYGFKEDGTGFIGKSGHGRIIFDGNKSQIYNSGYFTSAGLLIDLDNPYISIHDNAGREIILINSKLSYDSVDYRNEPYLKIVGKKIQNINGTNVVSLQTILNIDDNSYYFSSFDPFTHTIANLGQGTDNIDRAELNGTYLNLTTGFFATKNGILGNLFFNENRLMSISTISLATVSEDADTGAVTTISGGTEGFLIATDYDSSQTISDKAWPSASNYPPGFYTSGTAIFKNTFLQRGYALFSGHVEMQKGIQNYIQIVPVTFDKGKIKNATAKTFTAKVTITGYDCVGFLSITQNHGDVMKISRFGIENSKTGKIFVRLTQHPNKKTYTDIKIKAKLLYIKRALKADIPENTFVFEDTQSISTVFNANEVTARSVYLGSATYDINEGSANQQGAQINQDDLDNNNPDDINDHDNYSDESGADALSINSLAEINSYIDSMNSAINTLSIEVDGLSTEVYQNIVKENNVNTLKKDVENLKADIYDNNNNSNIPLQTRINVVENQISNLSNRIDVLEREITQSTKIVNGNTVNTIKGNIDELLARVTALENGE